MIVKTKLTYLERLLRRQFGGYHFVLFLLWDMFSSLDRKCPCSRGSHSQCVLYSLGVWKRNNLKHTNQHGFFLKISKINCYSIHTLVKPTYRHRFVLLGHSPLNYLSFEPIWNPLVLERCSALTVLTPKFPLFTCHTLQKQRVWIQYLDSVIVGRGDPKMLRLHVTYVYWLLSQRFHHVNDIQDSKSLLNSSHPFRKGWMFPDTWHGQWKKLYKLGGENDHVVWLLFT